MLVSVVPDVGVKRTTTDAEPFVASLPRLQTTGLNDEQLPWDGVTPTIAPPAEIASWKTTLLASTSWGTLWRSSAPVLTTVIVRVDGWPTVYGPRAATVDTRRSAPCRSKAATD